MFVLPIAHPLSRRVSLNPGWTRAVERAADARIERADPEPATQLPAIDVVESDAAFTLTVDVPGLAKEHVKVSVEGRTVAIEASRDEPAAAADGQRVLKRERRAPRYARRLALPVDLDPATSVARVENGVLTLTLAKRVADGARTLTVQ